MWLLRHISALAARSRGSRGSSSSAKFPSEGGTKSSRSSLTFISLCVFLLFYLSLLHTTFFAVKRSLTLSHKHTFSLRFFLFSDFLTVISFTVMLFSTSVPFCPVLSVPPLSTPPLSLSRFLSLSLALSLFCYSSISDHWHRNGT